MTTTTRTQTQTKMNLLTTTALFAALICVTTAFICHIPVGINGGYIHIGDALIYLAATILPLPYALLSAAIGGVMADLLTAPLWAPATLIIKMLLVLPFTRKKETFINVQNIIALFAGFVISLIGYSVAELILFGSFAAVLSSVIATLIQSLGSAVVFLILGSSLDKMNFKKRFRL